MVRSQAKRTQAIQIGKKKRNGAHAISNGVQNDAPKSVQLKKYAPLVCCYRVSLHKKRKRKGTRQARVMIAILHLILPFRGTDTDV